MHLRELTYTQSTKHSVDVGKTFSKERAEKKMFSRSDSIFLIEFHWQLIIKNP